MKECGICYKRKKKFTTLQCDHEICVVCWNKWKVKQLNYYNMRYPTCPFCRQEQLPPDAVAQKDWVVRFLILVFLMWLMTGSPTPAEIPTMV